MKSEHSLKVGLIHKNVATTESSLGGGGDVFLIYLIRALKELGHYVLLSVIKPTPWDTIEKDLGWVYKPDLEILRFSPSIIDRAKLLKQFIPSPHIKMLKYKCDLTFNTYGDNLFWNTDIIYMHTPLTKDELSAKYQRNALSRLYYKVYASMAKKAKRKLKTLILTNSYYSKRIIDDTFGLLSKVIYPPIDTKFYKRALNENGNRQNYVVTVARLTRERNLEIIPELAQRVKGAIFHIIGSTVLPEASEVIKSIKKKALELNVADKVKIHTNLPSMLRLKIMAKSKVYLNTLREEHFGMAIAEAMSAGLAPIVPNDGGQVEIVPSSEYLYHDLEEAALKIEEWLSKWTPERGLQLSQAAEKFSYERFKREINESIIIVKHFKEGANIENSSDDAYIQ